MYGFYIFNGFPQCFQVLLINRIVNSLILKQDQEPSSQKAASFLCLKMGSVNGFNNTIGQVECV